MSDLDRWLQTELAHRKQQGLYRVRYQLSSPQGVRIVLDGQLYDSFCSNDYLALANHPRVVNAAQQAAAEYGVGSGAAHLITGHSRIHEQLESALAKWVGRPRALLFSTGYMANMGVLNSLTGPEDCILEDSLNHASLLDAGWLSRADMHRFEHGNMTALDAEISLPRRGRTWLVTDAVFSMDGEVADLPHLVKQCRRYDANLMIDDAHGFGVLGESGRGTANHFGLDHEAVPVYMATLGKALGCFGAFVAGSESLIEYLIQRARTFIYTTAMSPVMAAAAYEALMVLQQEPERQERLFARIRQFKEGALQLGLPIMPSETAIQPFKVGRTVIASRLAEVLRKENIIVSAIRPPTVPEGTARLRVTLSADHEMAQVDRLLAALDKHWQFIQHESRSISGAPTC